MRKSTSGFTIVELLIVVIVLSILASITVVSFGATRQRANDAKRLSDAKTITERLSLYHMYNNRTYPVPTSTNGSWEESFEDTPGSFMEYMATSNVLSSVPVDPVNTGTKTYRYYRYSVTDAQNYGCDTTKGPFYVFGILDMETSGRPHPDSPGWSCTNRNWSTEFDWVTGGFENP